MSSPSQTLSGEYISNNDNIEQRCETLLNLFEASDQIVQAGRNTLKRINFEGSDCVVKAFRIPKFPQNYSYGILSKSKAKKSYDNAKKLISLGFSSPTPIAYFEYRSAGKLKASYYICEFAANTQTLHALLQKNPNLEPEFIKEFATFCRNLHHAGILHRDFNPKNILISEDHGDKSFSLVDINRITWSNALSLEKSMASLSRLSLNEPTTKLLIEQYAKLAQVDSTQCQDLLNKAEQKTQRYFKNKKRFRKIFPKKR